KAGQSLRAAGDIREMLGSIGVFPYIHFRKAQNAAMKCAAIIITLLALQDIPFKPAEEFAIVLEYEFRERPSSEENEVYLSTNSTNRRIGPSLLPYLTLNMTFHSFPEDRMRMRITANHPEWRVVNRRVVAGATYPLTLGYIADMVDRVSPYEYTITFLNSGKQAVDKIVIRVDEDGVCYINDEKSGSF